MVKQSHSSQLLISFYKKGCGLALRWFGLDVSMQLTKVMVVEVINLLIQLSTISCNKETCCMFNLMMLPYGTVNHPTNVGS